MLKAYYREKNDIFDHKFNYALTTSLYKLCDVKISWADSNHIFTTLNHSLNRTDEAPTLCSEVSQSEKAPDHWLNKIT